MPTDGIYHRATIERQGLEPYGTSSSESRASNLSTDYDVQRPAYPVWLCGILIVSFGREETILKPRME